MVCGGLFLAAAGLFSIAGAVMNWNWFMLNRRARLFVTLFGRGGARVAYVIIGLVLIGMGVLVALGVGE